MRKKILVIVDGYDPANSYGGPPISIKNLCELLYDSYDFFIITTDHEIGDTKKLSGIAPGWNVRPESKVLYVSEKDRKRIIKQSIYEIKPDLIYLNSLFDYQSLLLLLINSTVNVLVAPRGQLLAGAMKYGKLKKSIYWKFVSSILKFKKNFYIQATSFEEYENLNKVIEDYRIIQMGNIPSFNIVKKEENRNPLSRGILNIAFISRIVPKKNLLFALQVLSKLKFPIKFNIYGNIEDLEYWRLCQQEIDKMPANVDVEYMGEIPHEQVKIAFSKNDVFLFPTFSENFGHVISEALFSKCIVVISDQTPWNDLEEASAGFICSLNDKESFINSLNKIYNFNQEEFLTYHENIENYLNKKFELLKLKESIKNTFEKELM